MHYEKFHDGSVKCIEDELPFEVPDGWAWCRYSHVIELYSGQDLTSNQYNDIGEGIPYITGASNLEHGKVIINRWTTTPTTHATIGDLLLTVKGTVGKMAFCNIADAHIARQIMALRCTNAITPQYLHIAISAMLNDITAQANGIIPGIRREIVLGAYLPLPPINEQNKICEMADSSLHIIDIIDADKDELKKAIQITKSKMLDLAIRGKLVPQDPNDEPASVLLERIHEEKEELIKQGKIKRNKKESVIFRGDDNSYYLRTGELEDSLDDWQFNDLPKTWEICCLGEICDYGNCKNVDTADIDDNAWILDLEDIEKDTGLVFKKVTKREKNSVSTKHQFHSGQVLYSKLRPYLNKVVLSDDDGYCTSEILPLEFDKCVLPAYARYYLMSGTFLAYAGRCSYGVKMPRLGTVDGKKAIFSLPPLAEQKRIVEAIEHCFSQLNKVLEAIA